MPPGHDLTRFYALLPLLAVLAVLQPNQIAAVTAAVQLLISLRQLP